MGSSLKLTRLSTDITKQEKCRGLRYGNPPQPHTPGPRAEHPMSFLSTPRHALWIKDVIEETRSKGLLQDQECNAGLGGVRVGKQWESGGSLHRPESPKERRAFSFLSGYETSCVLHTAGSWSQADGGPSHTGTPAGGGATWPCPRAGESPNPPVLDVYCPD